MTNDAEQSDQGAQSAVRHPAFAIGSLILGIVAVLTSLFLVGMLFGVVGLALGIVYRQAPGHRNSMALAGGALSSAGIAIAFVLIYQYYSAVMERARVQEEYMAALEEWAGEPAPDVTLPTVDGGEIDLTELQGRPALLTFWTPGCTPCWRTKSHMNRLAAEYNEDELALLGVTPEDPEEVQAFLEEHEFEYPIAIAAHTELPPPYEDALLLPVTIALDADGVIRDASAGGKEYEDLLELAFEDDD